MAFLHRWREGRAINRELARLEAKAAAADFASMTPDEMLGWANDHKRQTKLVHARIEKAKRMGW